LRSYIDNELNCVLVCHEFHVSDGWTLAYKSACVETLAARYGRAALLEYVRKAPLKMPASVTHMLEADDRGKEGE